MVLLCNIPECSRRICIFCSRNLVKKGNVKRMPPESRRFYKIGQDLRWKLWSSQRILISKEQGVCIKYKQSIRTPEVEIQCFTQEYNLPTEIESLFGDTRCLLKLLSISSKKDYLSFVDISDDQCQSITGSSKSTIKKVRFYLVKAKKNNTNLYMCSCFC